MGAAGLSPPPREAQPVCLLSQASRLSGHLGGDGVRGLTCDGAETSDARGEEQRGAARTLSLTCLVACRLTMTSFPPLFFVISGRLPLGLICREVPRVMERSAFLQGGDKTSRAEKKPWLFAGCLSYSAPAWTLQVSQPGSKAAARIYSGFSWPLFWGEGWALLRCGYSLRAAGRKT